MIQIPCDILVCPISHQPLREASSEELEKLQQLFAAGSLLYQNEEPVPEYFTNALVRQDSQIAYLVKDEIPALLPSEAICL